MDSGQTIRWYKEVEGFARLDELGARGADFLFVISFDRRRILAEPLEQLPDGILYKLGDWRNAPARGVRGEVLFRKNPPPFARYLRRFEAVLEEIRAGNTYLLNLTAPTPVETNLSLSQIHHGALARYKLHVPGLFSCFSPEKFIEISEERIRTYPMKGTIDASLPGARNSILENPKERAEHVMIVDLMRNDLGQVAREIRVQRFRYIDEVHTGRHRLLQVSSEISGRLDPGWRGKIGTILSRLTPAGSVSGTPKRKTLEIIRRIEGYDRGFYTGVFGICRGEELRSAVMIRFVEATDDGLVYKSGGGITLDSDPYTEYEELIDKIYLPIGRRES